MHLNGMPKISMAGMTPDKHRRGMDACLKKHAELQRNIALAPQILGDDDLQFLKPRLSSLSAPDLHYDLLFQSSANTSQGVLIQLPERLASISNCVTNTRPWIRFEIDPAVYGAWLNGSERFEVVLETSRFQVYRHPDQHDPRIWGLLRLGF